MTINMMKFLAVFDLDGTLLDREHRITERNLKSVKKLKEMGVEVAIASGRPLPIMYHYAKQLEVNFPLITSNGARIVDHNTGEELASFHFDFGNAKKMIEFLMKNEYDWMAYTGNLIVSNYNPRYLALQKEKMKVENSVVLVDDLEEIEKYRKINKILIMEEDAGKIEAFRKFSENFSDMKYIKSQSTYFDLIPHDTGKGPALKYLCDQFNISPDRVAAFGDETNDLGMLRLAKYPITTENACEEVKESSLKVFASNVDDGVSEGIEWLIDNVLNKELK